MKKIYIISMVLLFSIAYSQDKKTTKADKYFEGYQYTLAIDEYSKLVDNNNDNNEYIYRRLADCYYITNDLDNASKWYAKAVVAKTIIPEVYFRYAQVLKSTGKYEEANKQMTAFSKLAPKDTRAIDFLNNPDYLTYISEQKALYEVKRVNVDNDGKSDFGPFLSNNNLLYFVSNRKSSGKTDKWTNQPYIDIFRCSRGENSKLSSPEPVSELNSPFHDGPVTISEDGKTMFFARDSHSENQFEKIKESNVKLGQQGIYKATNIGGVWSQIESLPINSTRYSVSSPSLSKDGTTLFFASNMPGGYGETDIWKVSINDKGYGKPENLGEYVNTPARENFPFIDDENVLYFSSEGKLGLGGFDIFKISLDGLKQAENIGKPLNSEKDDFSFSFNDKYNLGYFSSNRSGIDQIYEATPICEASIVVLIENKKTGKPISNASVRLVDSNGNNNQMKESGADGKIKFNVSCKAEYTINASLQNFDSEIISVPPVQSGENIVKISLNPAEVIITETEVILNSIYFEFNKSDITPEGALELDKLVKVMKDHPTFVIFVKSHTDSKGNSEYNLKLSDKRAQSTVKYLISKGIDEIRLSGKGFGNTEPKINCGGNCTDEEDALNRRSEFLIVKK